MNCIFCSAQVHPLSPFATCARCTRWSTDHPYVDPRAAIGEPPEDRTWPIGEPGIVPFISPTARIEAFCTVDAGTKQRTWISGKVWLMKGVHVGHDAFLGHNVEIAPHTSVGGHVVLCDDVKVGQGATFKPYVTVGAGARIGMGAVVICDVPARRSVGRQPC